MGHCSVSYEVRNVASWVCGRVPGLQHRHSLLAQAYNTNTLQEGMVRAKEALDTLAEARAFKPHDRRMVQSMIDRNFQHIRMAATGRSGDSGPPPPPPGPPLPPPPEEPIWPARRHPHSGASSSGTPMPAAKGAPPAQRAVPYARLRQAPKAPALVSASASSSAAGWARGSIGDEVRAHNLDLEAAARHARRVKLDQAEADRRAHV